MADPDLAAMEARWNALRAQNVERQARLARQGVNADLDGIVRQVWLEHILRAVAGDEGVLRCRIDTQERIAEILSGAEPAVNRAKLMAPGNGGGH